MRVNYAQTFQQKCLTEKPETIPPLPYMVISLLILQFEIKYPLMYIWLLIIILLFIISEK